MNKALGRQGQGKNDWSRGRDGYHCRVAIEAGHAPHEGQRRRNYYMIELEAAWSQAKQSTTTSSWNGVIGGSGGRRRIVNVSG